MKPAASRVLPAPDLAEIAPTFPRPEFGLIIAWHAFARWMMRCMTTAGVKDMTPIDVLVLHHASHRDSEKRLAEIPLRARRRGHPRRLLLAAQLAGLGLVQSVKKGRRRSSPSPSGAARSAWRTATYARPADARFTGSPEDNAQIGELARPPRTLSGRQRQAARAASTSSL